MSVSRQVVAWPSHTQERWEHPLRTEQPTRRLGEVCEVPGGFFLSAEG
jgi:hypothetical protein